MSRSTVQPMPPAASASVSDVLRSVGEISTSLASDCTALIDLLTMQEDNDPRIHPAATLAALIGCRADALAQACGHAGVRGGMADWVLPPGEANSLKALIAVERAASKGGVS